VSNCVLDASAVLALLLEETGAAKVKSRLSGGKWSAVNYAEVLTRLVELSGSLEGTRSRLDRLELTVVAFDADQAAVTASIRPATKRYGLSLADRACLALALTSSLPVLTADQSWGKFDLGVKVHLIR
jgi:ribonuclease VapC